MSFNLNSLNSSELEKLQIMNSLAGMNPTGQLLLNKGVFQSQGNPAQIVTTASLQKKSLQNSANNSYSSNSVQISEKFENKKMINYNLIHYDLILFFILLIICIYILLKKNKIL